MARKKNAVRPDGRIAVQVYLGKDEDGKRKYKTAYGRTQKEAEANAEEIKLSLRKGLDVMAATDTFGEWGNHWIKLKALEVSASQRKVYESSLSHACGYIGAASITKIRVADIQNIILNLADKNPNTGKPASKKMLLAVKSTVAQVFELAIQSRVTDFNPAASVKIPNTYKPILRRALTAEEQHWITDTPHRAQRAAMIMMYAGLRRGELIPLTWNDIDIDNRTISVNKAVEKKSNRFHTKDSGKTDASIRTVDIPDVLAEFLSCEKRESIYVCTSAKNEMHTESSWCRMWESYLSELNFKYGDFINRPGSKFDPSGTPFVIPRITPHWLRHTFATMLYLAGVDVLAAKEQLGHEDIKTTLDIYTHLDNKHKRRAMNKLNDFLRPCKSDASQANS